jgi:hypothetical protein
MGDLTLCHDNLPRISFNNLLESRGLSKYLKVGLETVGVGWNVGQIHANGHKSVSRE